MTTEKELAGRLFNAWNNPDTDWLDVARTAAEELGVTLAPDKPEPGTWHIVAEPNCDYTGRAARVSTHGSLRVFEDSDDGEHFSPDEQWPDLIPARVISEETFQRLASIRADEEANPADDQYAPAKPPVLSEEKVGRVWDALAGSRAEWEAYTGPFHEHVTAVVNAARAKHGWARELPNWGQVRDAVASCKGNGWGLTAEPINAITDAVMALLGGGDRGE